MQRFIVVTFNEVLNEVFLPQICIAFDAVLLKLNAKLARSGVDANLSKLWPYMGS